jgi:hypothetical protein
MHRVVFEQLLAAWQQLMQRGMALLRAANQQHDTQAPEGAAGGRKGGRGKQKQQLALPVDGFGRLQWDEEQVSEPLAGCFRLAVACGSQACARLLKHALVCPTTLTCNLTTPPTQAGEVLAVAQRYADVFAGLVELTKKHASRNMLLSSALKLGSSFLEVMLKALPFWAATYVSDAPGFTALVKSVQKGTKVMQVRVCLRTARAEQASGWLHAPAATPRHVLCPHFRPARVCLSACTPPHCRPPAAHLWRGQDARRGRGVSDPSRQAQPGALCVRDARAVCAGG